MCVLECDREGLVVVAVVVEDDVDDVEVAKRYRFTPSYTIKNDAADGAEPKSTDGNPAYIPRMVCRNEGFVAAAVAFAVLAFCNLVLIVSRGYKEQSTVRPAMAPDWRTDHDHDHECQRVSLKTRGREGHTINERVQSDETNGCSGLASSSAIIVICKCVSGGDHGCVNPAVGMNFIAHLCFQTPLSPTAP